MKTKIMIVTLLLLCLITISAVNASNEINDIQTSGDVTSDTSNNDYDNTNSMEKTITTDNKINNNIKTEQESNKNAHTELKEITHITSEVVPDYLIVTLKDDNASPVKRTLLNVNITNSQKYNTNDNGQVLVPLTGISPNNYTVQINYPGDRTHLPTSSNVTLNIGPVSDDYKITTQDVSTNRDLTIIFDATVLSENKTVDGGRVYYQIDGKPVLNENGSAIYSEVQYNMVSQEYIIPNTLSLGKHTLTVIYLSTENIRAYDTKTLTITNIILSGASGGDEDDEDYSGSQRLYGYRDLINSASMDTQVIHNSAVVSESKVITLQILNNIFNQTFINGHLIVYIDGELVFNDTITDDLSQFIFELLEKYIGQHEIKVEFTDSNNNTKTYNETVTLEYDD